MGISNTCAPLSRWRSDTTPSGSLEAQHRRHADPGRVALERAQLPADILAKGGLVEELGEAAGAKVELASGRRQLEVDAARRDALRREVRGRQRREEVAQLVEASDHGGSAIGLRPAHIAANHRRRCQRGWSQRADRGGQQQVALEAASVGVARVGHQGAEALQRLGDASDAGSGVGVVGLCGYYLLDRGARAAFARMAPDIDCAAGPVGRALALRQHKRRPPGLGQRQRAHQPCEPGADDDCVAHIAP